MTRYALNALGTLYTIEFEYMDSELHGILDNGVIKINSRHIDTVQDTIVHEFLHAILERSGLTQILDHKTEEAVVCAIENGLMGSNMIKPLVFDPCDANEED